jgi:DNA-binding GntR family transcriptional regulator
MTDVDTRSAVEVCTDRLREMIADGDLTAGQPLRQDELAARLGTSRTPIREAVGRLHSEGLVVMEKNRGATVANPTPERLLEIYEVRMLLEPHAAALAAETIDAEHIAVLADLYERMDNCPPWEFYRLNRSFHLAVYAVAGHATLYEHIRGLRYRSDPYVRILIGGGGGAAAQHGHRELLDALEAHNAFAARSATRDHLMSTVNTVTSLLTARRQSSRSQSKPLSWRFDPAEGRSS